MKEEERGGEGRCVCDSSILTLALIAAAAETTPS